MRRRTFLALAGAGTVAGCVSAPRTASEEWPMWRGDVANTGVQHTSRGPQSPPRLSWRARTGDAIWGSPAVVDGYVLIPSYDGNLWAFDADTGERRWRYETDDRIDSSPAVMDGLCYFGGFDGYVHAVDVETGERQWRHDAEEIVRSSPVVDDEYVYIGTHCQFTECAVYYDREFSDVGYVIALDRVTGELEWRVRTNREVLSSPAVDDRRVYVGSSDHTVYAIDRTTGELDWTVATGHPIGASPAVAHDTVYIGDQAGNFHALRTSDGERRWRFRAGGTILQSSAAIASDRIFVGIGGHRTEEDDESVWASRLHAVDLDGERLWSRTTTGHVLGSSPAVSDGHVYVGTHVVPGFLGDDRGSGVINPGLFAFTVDGETAWHARVNDVDFMIISRGFGSSPAIANGRLYIGSASDHIYALE